MSVTASFDVEAGGGAGGCAGGGSGGCVVGDVGGCVGCGCASAGGRVVGGGGGSVVVVVAGAGIGSVSWNCSPRTGAATPASAGPAAASSICTVVVVITTTDVVVIDVAGTVDAGAMLDCDGGSETTDSVTGG
jgi:hypothetical protein